MNMQNVLADIAARISSQNELADIISRHHKQAS